MEANERFDDNQEAIRTAIAGGQAKLWTALPAIIQSYNPGAMTVEAQPTIQATKKLPDGSSTNVTFPLCLDVPVFFPGGGGFTLTFPVAKGDECLLVFSSRAIDSWWQSGGVQQPAHTRMHNLSDGFAFVGFRSKPRALASLSGNSLQLRSDDGATYVEVAAGVINVVTPTKVTLSSPDIELFGAMLKHNGANVGSTHKHPDPQGGFTGMPQ